ncbi:cornifelin homolog [Dendropsophus ebraccatus]|uniref:cornifelin homolog n=1 Tax=Dendropsophus ebraccatus TaxID=150705 RepID=UPI003831F649
MGADDQIKMQVSPAVPIQMPAVTPSHLPAAVPMQMATLTPTVPIALPVTPVISQPLPLPQPQPQVVLNVQTAPQPYNAMAMSYGPYGGPMGPMGGPMAFGPISWSTGLFQCCDDIPICILGCLCPAFLPCYLSTLFGEMCCFGTLPGAMFALRTGVRERYKIPGNLMNDYCAICCCLVCALCQMAREIKGREWHDSRLPMSQAHLRHRWW